MEELGDDDPRLTFANNAAIIQKSLDHLAQGISVFNADLELVLFNREFVEMLDFPDELARIGTAFETLIRFNVERGEYGLDAEETEIIARLDLARTGQPHCFERTRPNGKVLEIRGNPLPGGGFVTIYTDITALIEARERSKDIAAIDDLTGLNNRSLFLSLADQEVRHAQRFGRALSVIMLDADDFASINQSCGRDIGDKVMRALAEICKSAVRNVDVLGRFEGETFIALLPETDGGMGLLFAERLRRRVAEAEISTSAGQLSLTISMGLTSANGAEIDFARMLEDAAKALHEAKKGGRNCVVSAADLDFA